MSGRPAIVLVQPRIPQNVGAIGRVCAAGKASLHVVRPIPFEMSDRSLRRAGMDYLDLLDWQVHTTWDECRAALLPRRFWYLTTSGSRSFHDTELRIDDVLVFGCEPAGLPKLLPGIVPEESALRIPMPEPEARCLNLATSAAIALFELLRQAGDLRSA